jgi:Mg-chelatase subunit ChlD
MVDYSRRDILKYAGAVVAGVLGAALPGCTGSTDESQQRDLYDTKPAKSLEERAIDPRIKSIAFIIDTSGSMGSTVKGKRKIDSAKKCLLKIFQDYQDFYQKNGKLEAALFDFDSSESVINLVQLSPYNFQALSAATKGLEPQSGTPLGIAVAYAERELDKKAKGEKNIVILTDGFTTVGKDIVEVYKGIVQTNKDSNDSPTKVYVIAFDVNESTFSELRKLGVTVMQADDEKQLMEDLTNNKKQILAEDPNQK